MVWLSRCHGFSSYVTCLCIPLIAAAANTLIVGDDRNITAWFWQTAIVVDTTLFIAGGEYYNISGSGTPSFFEVTQDIAIDLSQSWTNSTVQGEYIDTTGITNVRRPMLWYDSDARKAYRYGGWPYNDRDTYPQSLYTLDVDARTWSGATVTGTNGLSNDDQAPGGACYTSSNTTFYSLGGSDAYSRSTDVQGFLEFHNNNASWTKTSSIDATANRNGYRSLAAAAVASQFGSQGYLVFVGGTSSESDPGQTTSSNLIGMSLVTLYDIDTGSWYQQETSGEAPPPRSAFCYASASSSDSFELFIYGGSVDSTSDTQHAYDTGYLNVWALSIPAFRWFKSTDSTQQRRANHYCTVIGNRQMISIGGSNPDDASLGGSDDVWANGIGIFDMTAFAWSDSYDANAAEYQSPDVVKDYYNSSFTTPSWSDPTLAEVFGSQASSSETPAATSGDGDVSQSSKSSKTGAIVGGVIGGVGGLLVIGIAIWCLKRRRRAKGSKQSDEIAQPSGHTSAVVEHYNTADYKKPEATTMSETPSQLEVNEPRYELGSDPPRPKVHSNFNELG